MAKRSPRKNVTRRQAAAGDPREVVERARELMDRGKNREALRILDKALLHHRNNAEILAWRGDALYLSRRIQEAGKAYKKALARDPKIFQAWYGLGCVQSSTGASVRAIDSMSHAVGIEPNDWDARYELARSQFRMGEVDAAIDQFEELARRFRGEARFRTLGEIAKIIPGSPARGNAEILRARVKWARLAEKIERPMIRLKPRTAKQKGKLRVGYVSAFFGSQNWMKPVWGVINEHDRAKFEIHLICDAEKPSAASGYRSDSRDAIHWIDGLSNEGAAKRVASAGLDVLVDLNGHSYPKRLGLFMRKPAQVQVGWFNMYATSGVRQFDYIIGDERVIPPEEEKYYTEKVLRVPGSYIAFRVLYPVPRVQSPPCLKTGQIAFGCLAIQRKITSEMIETWARILGQVPESRLVLKNPVYDERTNREAIWACFGRFGVEKERVALGKSAAHYNFLKAYAQIDIALDTFPYNGGTTTTEALWQGVPVLTFNGDRWVSRTSRSLLRAAGLGEWDVESKEEYVKRAVELANSPETPEMLAELRRGMREKLLDSPVCDTSRLCRDLEEIYATISRGEMGSPASFKPA
jgi:protein O-GlcNAc transferase